MALSGTAGWRLGRGRGRVDSALAALLMAHRFFSLRLRGGTKGLDVQPGLPGWELQKSCTDEKRKESFSGINIAGAKPGSEGCCDTKKRALGLHE
jgi:hypothetical protein